MTSATLPVYVPDSNNGFHFRCDLGFQRAALLVDSALSVSGWDGGGDAATGEGLGGGGV